jgi:hypothetical protein
MDKIDLSACEKILEYEIPFPEGSARVTGYKPAEGKCILSIQYTGNVPESFKNRVMEAIRSGSKSKEVYVFADKDIQ